MTAAAAAAAEEEEAAQPAVSAVQCEVCKGAQAKYKCPGCSARSCSAPCVAHHKQKNGCTGQRNRTAFVPLADFRDSHLLSDYNLLQDTARVRDTAQRSRPPRLYQHSLGRDNHAQGRNRHHHVQDRVPLPNALAALRTQAWQRGTKLLFTAPGMRRRKENTTYLDRKRRCIFWRVEWRFHGTDIALSDTRVDEHATPGEAVAKLLEKKPGNAVLRHKLQDYTTALDSTDGDSANRKTVCLYLKKEQCPANDQKYYLLDYKKPFREQLAGKTVIEFPVIHTALPKDAHNYPLVDGSNKEVEESSSSEASSSSEEESEGEEEEGVIEGEKAQEEVGALKGAEQHAEEGALSDAPEELPAKRRKQDGTRIPHSSSGEAVT